MARGPPTRLSSPWQNAPFSVREKHRLRWRRAGTGNSNLGQGATEPVLRERLEAKAKELNFIRNNLMIRHTEVGKPPIAESAQVDYLFHRMFAMIRLLFRIQRSRRLKSPP